MPGLVPEATGQPGGVGMADPLGMMNSLMDFQNKSNQNRQFQATFMANQALGEVMANAPSLEEGVAQALKNPLIAGFAREGVNTATELIQRQAATKMLGVQTAAAKTKLGQDSFLNVTMAGLQGADDPANWNKYFDSAMSGVDPAAMDFVKPRVDALKAGIAAKIQGLNLSDPAQAAQAQKSIQSLIGAGYIGAGGDRERLNTVLPSVQVGPDGLPIRTPSQIGAGRGEVPSLMQQQGAAQPTQAAPTPGPINPTTNQPTVVNPDTSSLFVTHPNGSVALNIRGQPVFRNTGLEEQNKILSQDFAGKEREQFIAAGNTINLSLQMDRAADDLNTKGGWYGTGIGGAFRGQLANLKETIEHAMGHQLTGPDTDLPEINADISQINKIHNTMAFTLMSQFEGKGREALGTLMTASNAVPGMENTPLAFKVINAGIRAMSEWEVKRRDFKEAWLRNPKSGGTLIGADEDFYRQVPPEALAAQELQKFGMTLNPKGGLTFTSDDAIERAWNAGLLGKKGSAEADAQVRKFHDTLHQGQ
jgi:hypothetical protein